MKIAVSSTGPALNDEIDARFGRCSYFLIVDPDSWEFEAVRNPNTAVGGGAGIQSAQLMGNKGVSVVLTGNCGPNAFQTFDAAGIRVITGVSGSIRQAVENYKSGKLNDVSSPNVESHFGMGMGGGMGTGRGMGGGMGRGMGGGMGRASGVGPRQAPVNTTSSTTTAPSPDSSGKKGDIGELKKQADALRKQMEEISARILELEQKGK
jgi:predicted Fe-Mo cluster-binding NifX family protein